MKYEVVFEKGSTSYGASVPDLPGCIAVGATLEEVRCLIAEAIVFHIEGLRADGGVVPLPSGRVVVEVEGDSSVSLGSVEVFV